LSQELYKIGCTNITPLNLNTAKLSSVCQNLGLTKVEEQMFNQVILG